DPAAYTVDWRLLSDVPAGYNDSFRDPAAVIQYRQGRLVPTDPQQPPVTFTDQPDSRMANLPLNNRLVIYELPTAWTRIRDLATATHVGVGTFGDVRALIEPTAAPANFAGVEALRVGRAYLQDLGINALELLPPADTFADRRSWGYATSNYFAPDFDLGRPLG